jgi:hypothetical protein
MTMPTILYVAAWHTKVDTGLRMIMYRAAGLVIYFE